MTRADIRKLIGGKMRPVHLPRRSAADPLRSGAGRSSWFDQLANEQGLKELLDEPGAKQS